MIQPRADRSGVDLLELSGYPNAVFKMAGKCESEQRSDHGKNFRILFAEKNNCLVRIQLQGDFDGTSAHELDNILRRCLPGYPMVTIDTEGLKSVNTFGLDVFSSLLKLLRRPHARIAFSGRYRSNFLQE